MVKQKKAAACTDDGRRSNAWQQFVNAPADKRPRAIVGEIASGFFKSNEPEDSRAGHLKNDPRYAVSLYKTED